MKQAVRCKVSRRAADESTVEPAMRAFLSEQGYSEFRWIGHQLCGLHRYNFTTGLVVGLSWEGYGRRYCFEHAHDARLALVAWDGNGHPAGPWIKCKGAGIDFLNPRLVV